jgi:3-isopropylmalate/(R)-2-methylmalate dehydratase large subunit
MDHIIDTDIGRTHTTKFPGGADFIKTFLEQTKANGIRLFDIGDPRQGIVHVISPEQGIALPGCTLVCADSHTGTVGALGAVAWGIGSTEIEHALVTQTLIQKRPKTMRIWVSGRLPPATLSKDLILFLIGRFGIKAANGFAVEYAGPAIEALELEQRLTVCNMSIEFGAWTGLIRPDDKTFEYIESRAFAPKGANWVKALDYWRTLETDESAAFDQQLEFDAIDVRPQVTWGINPGHVRSIDDVVPQPWDPESHRALDYMALEAGTPLQSIPIEAAFIGSCTNSRLSDLREAAAILRGQKVAQNVLAICVPGSTATKEAAEAEGLHKIFVDAGFEWRESGCSLCFYSGGDSFRGAQRVVSTTNRNFENRQGPSVRTHIASPATVAASAITGNLSDPRKFMD